MILFLETGAVSAALSKGAATNKVTLMLVSTLRTLAAQYDIALCTERVPSKANPAALPSRNREISLETAPNKERATVDELFPICDLA